MAENLYTCLECKEQFSKALLTCPKCGFKTAAGRVKDLQDSRKKISVTSNKKNTTEEKANEELDELSKKLQPYVAVGLVAIIGGCVALINNGGGSVKEPEEFDEIYARIWCKDGIKEQLKDPSSYKFYSADVVRTFGKYKQYGAATIDFGATNSFGGMVRQTAICDKLERNGKEYIRVNILP